MLSKLQKHFWFFFLPALLIHSTVRWRRSFQINSWKIGKIFIRFCSPVILSAVTQMIPGHRDPNLPVRMPNLPMRIPGWVTLVGLLVSAIAQTSAPQLRLIWDGFGTRSDLWGRGVRLSLLGASCQNPPFPQLSGQIYLHPCKTSVVAVTSHPGVVSCVLK